MCQGLLQVLIAGDISMILWGTSGTGRSAPGPGGYVRNQQDAMNAKTRITRNPERPGTR